MNKFITFAGGAYEAEGGFNDFLSAHDTKESAVCAGEGALRIRKTYGSGIDWWHVLDIEAMEIVESGIAQTPQNNLDSPLPTRFDYLGFCKKCRGTFRGEYNPFLTRNNKDRLVDLRICPMPNCIADVEFHKDVENKNDHN